MMLFAVAIFTCISGLFIGGMTIYTLLDHIILLLIYCIFIVTFDYIKYHIFNLGGNNNNPGFS